MSCTRQMNSTIDIRLASTVDLSREQYNNLICSDDDVHNHCSAQCVSANKVTLQYQQW